MELFEIRILNQNGAPALVLEKDYLSIKAAENAARRLAGGRPFEIWNSDRCIFASDAIPRRLNLPGGLSRRPRNEPPGGSITGQPGC